MSSMEHPAVSPVLPMLQTGAPSFGSSIAYPPTYALPSPEPAVSMTSAEQPGFKSPTFSGSSSSYIPQSSPSFTGHSVSSSADSGRNTTKPSTHSSLWQGIPEYGRGWSSGSGAKLPVPSPLNENSNFTTPGYPIGYPNPSGASVNSQGTEESDVVVKLQEVFDRLEADVKDRQDIRGWSKW
ncbi:hypothetical protein M427DRAFT_469236 [Gonapodya prolifera JEL478]|uniref:Uncharacterized protein n=1 Tax=Gonapodya prolifera (strain JEL478) TaxID=1344416 RepID=A0A139AQW4_GONPJ|nr:hypothetical protein M427DRAFT_469236 [Gonapodya prolifera JEL478]|eukprot:KXS19119.1 hypothetical protein M427DRAFT_469236 [Gonapodya prolifera JEL478]